MPKRKKQSRAWEIWDNPGVAGTVDAYWQNDNEVRHRRNLAKVVASYAKPSDSFLEVGCGTGRFYQALMSVMSDGGESLRYKGIDNSTEMLRLARENIGAKRGVFGYGDAFDLKGIGDYSHDFVLSFEVFGHLPDFSVPLAECLRIARKAVIFSVWVTLDQLPGPIKGSDHYEYPASLLNRTINQTILGLPRNTLDELFRGGTVYKYHQVDPVAVCVIPKTKALVDRLRGEEYVAVL